MRLLDYVPALQFQKNKTKQNKTKQNKTKQNKAKQNKTKIEKTNKQNKKQIFYRNMPAKK